MAHDITAFLAEWTQRTPHRNALAYQDQQWTFAQLSDRVRRAAGGLRALGEVGKRFAVLDKNHPATVELTLAAAQAGSTAVVVNWRLATEEIAYILNDSGAHVLFVGVDLLPQVEKLRGTVSLERVIVFDSEQDGYEPWLASSAPLATPVTPKSDDTFLLLYTSGTTGFPKGAMLTHRSVLSHTQTHLKLFSFSDRSVSLVPMPLFHVGGICWALLSLHAGTVSVITRDPTPAPLLAEIAKHKVTHTFIVPAILHGLTMLPDLSATDSLVTCVYGAAPVPLPVLEKCLARMKCDFYQVYGMTELAGVFCALDPVAHRDGAHPERLSSAGKMTPGNVLRVVEPTTLEDVERGTVGEFWVKSDQLMKGYWGKDEATRETITADGWMRTGDAGFVDNEGFVYVQDRVKDMVITGGENVYPAEIERVLVQHPAVSEVAVFGIPHEKWGESVRAAVALKPGQAATAEELIAYCKQHLASYKCPTSVEFLAALPRNPTGKVLKRMLREPYWAGRTRHV
jgi:acyl-CoA synthetase (AMP-forming)/AMP-acid ligase II